MHLSGTAREGEKALTMLRGKTSLRGRVRTGMHPRGKKSNPMPEKESVAPPEGASATGAGIVHDRQSQLAEALRATWN